MFGRERKFNFPQKLEKRNEHTGAGWPERNAIRGELRKLQMSFLRLRNFEECVWFGDLTFGLYLMLMSFSASFSRGSYLWHFPFSDAATATAAAGVVWSVSLVSCPCHSSRFYIFRIFSTFLAFVFVRVTWMGAFKWGIAIWNTHRWGLWRWQWQWQ